MENNKLGMMTLKEIQQNPELMIDEDIRAINQLFMSVKEFGKATEAYNVKIPEEVGLHMIASDFYREHLIMAAILDAFIEHEEISFKELNQSIYNRMPTDFLDLPASYFNRVIIKMIRFGYIHPFDTENNHPNFKITEDGIETLKNQTFQSLASMSFFNKQTFDFNKKTHRINKKMILISILMLISTIVSIVMSTKNIKAESSDLQPIESTISPATTFKSEDITHIGSDMEIHEQKCEVPNTKL